MPQTFTARRLAAVLLGVDLVLVLVHQARLDLGLSWRWALDVDGSFPEVYGYAKLLGAAVLLLALYRRRPAQLLLGWAFTLTVLAIDDGAQLHEKGGELFVRHLGLSEAFGLRAVDLGEVLVWGLLGVLLAALLWDLHRREVEGWARPVSLRLAGLVLLLAGFAVGVDMVHQVLPESLYSSVALVEDGCELVVMSLVAAYARLVQTTATERSSQRWPASAQGLRPSERAQPLEMSA